MDALRRSFKSHQKFVFSEKIVCSGGVANIMKMEGKNAENLPRKRRNFALEKNPFMRKKYSYSPTHQDTKPTLCSSQRMQIRI